MNFAQRPGDQECFDYHCDYVALVPDGNILDTLKEQMASVPNYIANIPDEQFETVHAPYGWSIRTVIEHCCDAERVFGYRILRFAAGDQTELPGWDQDVYADSRFATNASIEELADEFSSLRSANMKMLCRLEHSTFDNMGIADGRKMSVRTIVWLMAGHWIHHHKILEQRLGQGPV